MDRRPTEDSSTGRLPVQDAAAVRLQGLPAGAPPCGNERVPRCPPGMPLRAVTETRRSLVEPPDQRPRVPTQPLRPPIVPAVSGRYADEDLYGLSDDESSEISSGILDLDEPYRSQAPASDEWEDCSGEAGNWSSRPRARTVQRSSDNAPEFDPSSHPDPPASLLYSAALTPQMAATEPAIKITSPVIEQYGTPMSDPTPMVPDSWPASELSVDQILASYGCDTDQTPELDSDHSESASYEMSSSREDTAETILHAALLEGPSLSWNSDSPGRIDDRGNRRCQITQSTQSDPMSTGAMIEHTTTEPGISKEDITASANRTPMLTDLSTNTTLNTSPEQESDVRLNKRQATMATDHMESTQSVVSDKQQDGPTPSTSKNHYDFRTHSYVLPPEHRPAPTDNSLLVQHRSSASSICLESNSLRTVSSESDPDHRTCAGGDLPRDDSTIDQHATPKPSNEYRFGINPPGYTPPPHGAGESSDQCMRGILKSRGTPRRSSTRRVSFAEVLPTAGGGQFDAVEARNSEHIEGRVHVERADHQQDDDGQSESQQNVSEEDGRSKTQRFRADLKRRASASKKERSSKPQAVPTLDELKMTKTRPPTEHPGLLEDSTRQPNMCIVEPERPGSDNMKEPSHSDSESPVTETAQGGKENRKRGTRRSKRQRRRGRRQEGLSELRDASNAPRVGGYDRVAESPGRAVDLDIAATRPGETADEPEGASHIEYLEVGPVSRPSDPNDEATQEDPEDCASVHGAGGEHEDATGPSEN